jgi:hypothetical protein
MRHRILPFAVLLLALSAVQAAAQISPTTSRDEIFVVRNIYVDATADTISAAREQAFADGRTVAFSQLISRMAVDRSQLDEDSLTDEDITSLLQAFEVNDERTTTGRYIANLTFAFDPAAVRRLLQSRLVDFTETVSKPVLVIPVFRSAQGARLWDSPNPWMESWLDFFDTERLVPVVVPFGDLADVADISIAEALTGDAESLRAIATRYNAGDTIVALAEPYEGGLTVALNRYPEAGDRTVETLLVPGAESLQSMLSTAVQQSTETIEAEWRERTRVSSADTNSLAVLVPVSVPADWFQTQSRLARVPTITATKIISLSSTEAVLEFQFIGSQAQLQTALAQQNLVLDGPDPNAESATPRLYRSDSARIQR